jgi:hypothetical protein
MYAHSGIPKKVIVCAPGEAGVIQLVEDRRR